MGHWTATAATDIETGRSPGLRLSALGFAAGVGAFHLLPRMPPDWLAWVLGLAGLLLLSPSRPRLARPVGALLLGALWAMLHVGAILWSPFPETLTRSPLVVEGRIASIPTDLGYALRFRLQVESARSAQGPVPFRGLVRLNWYDAPHGLVAGERWRFPVRLKPPHGFANPGGFDYERWLFQSGILATGSVRRGVAPLLLDPGPGAFRLTRLRQHIAERLAAVLDGSPALGLVLALTIGDRSALDRGDWDLLTRTGTNHLVAISGLHVGLIAAAVFFLIRRTWGLVPRLALWLPAPRCAAVAAALAALTYAGLAGFSVSTQRALIMLSVLLGAVFFRRTLRPWYAISLAVAGVLLVDPKAVLSYGFWLSFGAVAAILLHLGQRLPDRRRWGQWGHAQWAVALGLLPLLLGLFGRASLIAPAVNLVAVPLFSLVLLPLVLLGALASLLFGLHLPLVWAADLLTLCLGALARVAELPWAAVGIGERPPWAWAAAGAGALLLLAPRGLPGRSVGAALMLPLLALRPPGPVPGEAWVTLLDVGQGLCAVVRTAAGVLVFDTGPGFDSGFNTGSLVLAPFLVAQGLDKVDVLVLSHGDRDHSGGASGLMRRLEVGRILAGEPEALGVPQAWPCRAGDGWIWSGVELRFLHPPDRSFVGNDASCVLRVASGGASILLTGDITQRVELDLVRAWGEAMRSDVLVAGHHGSATSTSEPLLDAVDPSLVLYASGFANAFGFPAREVRERVRARGIAALDTAHSGAIGLRLLPQGGIDGPWAWRERSTRLWTHLPAPSRNTEEKSGSANEGQ